MSRTALVTGSTGFIGSALARRLAEQGWNVHRFVRSRSGAHDCEHSYTGEYAEVAAAVAAAEPDIVFHLASLYLADHRQEDIAPLIASNVLLTAQLAEAICTLPAPRLVNAGTAWQHFAGSGYHPVNLYAATKQAGQDILSFYCSARGLTAITLKLFDTYGPGDTRRKLIQLLVDAAVTGEPLELSPGEQIIDLSHVDDVVDAFLVAGELVLAASAPLDESFFVSGERQSVRALAARVGAALDRPLALKFGARAYRPREVMEPAAARPALPGWVPRRSLDDGVRALAQALPE